MSMSIQVTARRSGAPYVQAAAEAVGRAVKMLRRIGYVLLTAMQKSRSAQAARFLDERHDLLDNIAASGPTPPPSAGAQGQP